MSCNTIGNVGGLRFYAYILEDLRYPHFLIGGNEFVPLFFTLYRLHQILALR